MKKIVFAASLTALFLFAPSAFAAGECDTDADCESYESCELLGQAGCACPPGDAGCDCPDSGTDDYYECVAEPPDSCDSNADCSDGLECVTRTYEQCTGSGGGSTCSVSPDGGTDCEDAGTVDTSESCETFTEGYCVPPYLAPCEQDADCGTGFTCEEYEICECSGGGSTGSGGDDPGDAGTSAEDTGGESCVCETAGKSCELVETECTSDADCAGDLTCQTYDDQTTTEPCVDDGDASSCETADAGTDATKYCLPPDWERWEDTARDIHGESGDSSDEDGGGESSTNSDAGGLADTSQGPGADDSSGSSGGCSSTGEHAPVGALVMVALGLLGLAHRRHRDR